MFGKIMSIPDRLMPRYYELLTDVTPDDIGSIKSGAMHPMEAKKRLARMLVTEYHNAAAAEAAARFFESKFQRREVPDDVPVFKLGQTLWVCELMTQLGFASSTSEARRLLGQGAVRVDGHTVNDVNFRFVPGQHKILEVGRRRIARIES